MNTSVVSPPQARAREVEFVPDAFVVHLEDGRSPTVPVEWFPRLRDATPEEEQLAAHRARDRNRFRAS